MATETYQNLDEEIEHLRRELLRRAQKEIETNNPESARQILTQIVAHSEGSIRQEAELLLTILSASSTSQENLRLIQYIQTQISNVKAALEADKIAEAWVAQEWLRQANRSLLLLVEVAGRPELRNLYLQTQNVIADLQAECTFGLKDRIETLLCMDNAVDTLRTQLLLPTQQYKEIYTAVQDAIVEQAVELTKNFKNVPRSISKQAILAAARGVVQDNAALLSLLHSGRWGGYCGPCASGGRAAVGPVCRRHPCAINPAEHRDRMESDQQHAHRRRRRRGLHLDRGIAEPGRLERLLAERPNPTADPCA